VAVPRNDGVVGSINSARLAGLPHVLEFVVGASQVLAGEPGLPRRAIWRNPCARRNTALLHASGLSGYVRRHALSHAMCHAPAISAAAAWCR
jgi:hypothetical protein